MCRIKEDNLKLITRRLHMDCMIVRIGALFALLLGTYLLLALFIDSISIAKLEKAELGGGASFVLLGAYALYILPIKKNLRIAKYETLEEKFSRRETMTDDGEEKLCELYYELLGSSMVTLILPSFGE